MSYINPRYTQMKEENDAMNSLLIERDAEIELLKKVEKRLENEVERTELTEKILCESNEDFICFGRRELAKELQAKIKNWRKELLNEKGEN